VDSVLIHGIIKYVVPLRWAYTTSDHNRSSINQSKSAFIWLTIYMVDI